MSTHVRNRLRKGWPVRIELSFRQEEAPDVALQYAERHIKQLDTAAWRAFKQRVYDVRLAVTGRETQQALAAGARAIAKYIGIALDAATTSYYRWNASLMWSRYQRGIDNDTTLLSVIKGRQGREEYFPSAYVQLRGPGAYQARLVDEGHAGPTPGSPRTPPHPYIDEGIDASEGPRDRAILKAYQYLFPEMTRAVRRGTATP